MDEMIMFYTSFGLLLVFIIGYGYVLRIPFILTFFTLMGMCIFVVAFGGNNNDN